MEYPWLKSDIIGSFAYADRYINHDSNPTSNIPLLYSPTSPQSSFSIKAYKVPRNVINIIKSDPSNVISDYILPPGEEYAMLFVHPDVLNMTGVDYLEYLKEYEDHAGFPTSSFRTIGIITGKGVNNNSFSNFYCAKTNYPKKITLWGLKSFGPRTIAQSVTLSSYLSEFKHPKFAQLPETIGISFPTKNELLPSGEPDFSKPPIKKGWGMSIREMTPRPAAILPTPAGDSEWHMLPLYSIYSHDSNDLSRPLIIEILYKKFLERGGTLSVVDYIMDNFIQPILECFVRCLEQTGIFLMPHAQNVRYEIDSQFNIGRSLHQDWDTYVDLELRQSLGLPIDNIHIDNTFFNDLERNPKEMYSYIYDTAIGASFDAFAQSLDGVYWFHFDANGIRRSLKPSVEFQQKVSQCFGELMPYHKKVFSDFICHTDHATMAASRSGRHRVCSSGKLPKWRPLH